MRIRSTWALLSLLAPALAGAETPPAPAARTRVAVLDLRPIGVETAKAELLSEVALTEAASLPGLEVIGRSDIQAMLGFEKQKKILGCEEDSACIAEIGGALGVKLVLVGSVGKIGALYRLDLKVLDTAKGGAVRRQGVNVEGAEEKMVAAVQQAVRQLFARETGSTGPAEPAAAAATSAEPATAPGAEAAPAQKRLVLGGRLAFGAPGGNFDTDLSQDEFIQGLGSFQLEVGWKLTPAFTLGAYASYGAGVPGKDFESDCKASGTSCTVAVARFGVDLSYRFGDAASKFVPWLGAGLGFESFEFSGSEPDGDFKLTASGFEPLHVEAGLDFAFSSARIGPYVSFAIARYSTGKIDLSALGASNLELDGAMHRYVYLGVRGAVEL